MTINKTQFNTGLKDIRNLAMTPREKGEIFHKLYNYTQARPVPSEKTLLAAALSFFRKVFVNTK